MKLYLCIMGGDGYEPVASVGKEYLSVHTTLEMAKSMRAKCKYGVDYVSILEINTEDDYPTVYEVYNG